MPTRLATRNVEYAAGVVKNAAYLSRIHAVIWVVDEIQTEVSHLPTDGSVTVSPRPSGRRGGVGPRSAARWRPARAVGLVAGRATTRSGWCGRGVAGVRLPPAGPAAQKPTPYP